MKDESIICEIDEEIVYDQLEKKKDAIWSLLLASGYLKVLQFEDGKQMEAKARKRPQYILALTNKEVRYMFEDMVSGWFDNGSRPSGSEPERFYHGFVLGLLVELEGRYNLISNRESGFGRYDVLL